jgi:rod shape-determining protein MreB
MQPETSPVVFTIAYNFRDTEIRASRGEVTVWREMLSFGGIDLIIAIMEYLKTQQKLLVGRHTAERVIMNIGSALPLDPELTMMVKGRSLVTGLPAQLEMSSVQVREAIHNPLTSFVGNLPHTISDRRK